MIRVIFKAGIIYFCYAGVGCQPLRDPSGILLLAVHPDPERLDATGRQPGILWSQDGPHRVLMEVNFFGEPRLFDGYDTGDGIVVSGQVFGRAVDSDISTQV